MPRCPIHSEIELEAKKRGWYCEECGTNVLANERTRDVASIVSELPTLLALPLNELDHETHPTIALWTACDFVELSLKLVVMLGLATHVDPPEPLLRVLRTQVEVPTLGRWLDMARAIARHASPASPPQLAETVASLARLLQGDDRDATIDDALLPLRNRLAHGGPMRRAEAAKLLAAWKPRIQAWAVDALGWLRDTTLVAVGDDHRRFMLRGIAGHEVVGEEIPADAPPGSAWLCLPGRTLRLAPLGAFDAERRAMLVYVRRGDTRLKYLRLDDDGGLCDSSPTAFEQFRALFAIPPTAASHLVRSFEPEIRRDAARRIGRERELEVLRVVIRTAVRGLVWVGGAPGIGKSNLMAAIMEELHDQPPPDTFVMSYRFRAGDERCGRAQFLTYTSERLHAWLDGAPASPKATVRDVRGLLDKLRAEARVVFLLDGLDEIVERDRTFVDDVITQLVTERVLVVGAGRSEYDIAAAFARHEAIDVFPGGLPPMSDADVRALLLDRTGPARKRLLGKDKEYAEGVRNAFIERVALRSEGLPIYVSYVVGDLIAGRLDPEVPDTLPTSLHAYHDELLRRAAVGDLQAIATPALVLLALSYAPLTRLELLDLLRRRGVMASADLALIDRVLASLASMLRTVRDREEEAFTIFHHSLRTHVLASDDVRETVRVTRHALAELAMHPIGDHAEGYLLRTGIRHLVDEGRAADANQLMTRLDLLMARLANRSDEVMGVTHDWLRLSAVGDITEAAKPWHELWQAHAHLLARGSVDWPSPRILLQLASEAAATPVSEAAEAVIATGRYSWRWLRLIPALRRSAAPARSAERVVEAHVRICGLAAIGNDAFVSADIDGKLQVWDLTSGERRTSLSHPGALVAFGTSSDGAIAVGGFRDGLVRVWNLQRGTADWTLEGHTREIQAVAVDADGTRVLSAATDKSIRLWDVRRGTCVWTMASRDTRALAFLDDDRAISCNADGDVSIWTLANGAQQSGRPMRGGSLFMALAIDPGRQLVALSSAETGTTIWHSNSQHRKLDARVHRLAFSRDGAYLVGSRDSESFVWDTASGDRVCTFAGQDVRALAAGNTHLLTGDQQGVIRIRPLPPPKPRELDLRVHQPFLGESHRSETAKLLQQAGTSWIPIDGEPPVAIFEVDGVIGSIGVLPNRHDATSNVREVELAAGTRLEAMDVLGRFELPTEPLLRVLPVPPTPARYLRVTLLTNHGGPKYFALERVRAFSGDWQPPEVARVTDGHLGLVNRIAVGMAARVVVSCGADGSVLAWSLDTGSCTRVLLEPGTGISTLAIDPTGTFAAAGRYHDSRLRIWSLASGEASSHDLGHVSVVALGSQIMAAAHWSQTDGDPVATITLLRMPGEFLGAENLWMARGLVTKLLALTPNEDRLVSFGDDNELRIWRVDLGNRFRSLSPERTITVERGAGVERLAISSDGESVVAFGDRVRAWNLATGSPVDPPVASDRGLTERNGVVTLGATSSQPAMQWHGDATGMAFDFEDRACVFAFSDGRWRLRVLEHIPPM